MYLTINTSINFIKIKTKYRNRNTYTLFYRTCLVIIMTASNKEDLDLEANSAYTISECTDEPLIGGSLCTEKSLSSIPIKEDVELTGLTKPTESKKATSKQFSITQGKRKSFQVSVPPRATCLDISVKGRHKNRTSLTVYTPTGKFCGTRYGIGSISCRIRSNESKYIQQGKWMLVVSGDEGYTINASAHS